MQPLVHHHFFILIVEQEQIGFCRSLAAEDADLIDFVVDRRLDHAVMLLRHMSNFGQAEMWQQVLGDLVAGNHAVISKVIDQ
ncbi:hypothetical protein D3C75_910780 [compost metagenome]